MAPRPLRLSTLTAIALAALALGLSACAFKKDGEKPVDPQKTALQERLNASQPVVKSELKVDFIPLKKLNDYDAKVSWPTGRPIQINVTYFDGNTETFDVRTQASFKAPCVAGQIKFRFKSGIPGQDPLSDFEFAKACPTDLRIDGDFADILALNKIHGRLELGTGAKLKLGKDALVLDVDQIELHDIATVETFDNSRAPKLREGPSTAPPEIWIKARVAKGGLLSLKLNGIDGTPIPEPQDIENANLDLNGAPGTPGEIETYIPTLGAKGPDGAASKDRCIKKPGQGGNGLRATQTEGMPGTRGNSATNLSNVTINIGEFNEFKIEALLNPGIGSPAKRGAVYKGGAPGPGGYAPPPCKPAADGKPGDSSPAQALPGPGANSECGKMLASKNLKGFLSRKNLTEINCADSPKFEFF